MTQTTTTAEQVIDWDALYAADAVTEDAPCTTCHGESLLTCPRCKGELGARHECDACDADPDACDCPTCENSGQICCPDCWPAHPATPHRPKEAPCPPSPTSCTRR